MKYQYELREWEAPINKGCCVERGCNVLVGTHIIHRADSWQDAVEWVLAHHDIEIESTYEYIQ